MTVESTLIALREAFQDVARPEGLFIQGTCLCCECQEHNATLGSHDPDSITLKELGNPGWDPICFANNQAFAYYVPAMLRLAFEDPYYIDQLVFHFNIPGRVEHLTPAQAAAVLDALWYWMEFHSAHIAQDWDVTSVGHQFEEAIQRLEVAAGKRRTGLRS